MACNFPPPSTLRLQAIETASIKNTRIPIKTTFSHTQRSLCQCKAAQQEGATEDPSLSASSARIQLDLLQQLTSPTSDGAGLEDVNAAKSRQLTIREQLSALIGDREDEFTLPLGRKLKEGLKSLSSFTISQRRNIKRQTLLNKVSRRNDSLFFATVGAFVIVPPFAILAIAVLTGYVDLLP